MSLIELKNSPKPIVSCAINAKSCLTKKKFYSFKLIVLNKNIGPIIETVMTRCTIRFATEIAGTDGIGMFGRGLSTEISIYVDKIFKSELSGNVIDLCPVGALTSKPYPFVNRNWELKSINSFHFFKPYQIIICLGTNTNLEVLSLVQLLSQKYSFFKLKKPNKQSINIDFEQNYLLNSNLNDLELLKSNLCILIGINPRYEGSKLNLKLKSRYSKGNFKILNIGSLINLTFSNTNISSNIKILKSLTEGNSIYCQEFINSLQLIFITNTEIFKRNDSFGLTTVLTVLTKYVKIVSQSNQSYLNFLNPTINDSGFLNFKNIKSIQGRDFKTSSGIFFINNSFSTSNIKKLLNLKLFNFFKNDHLNNKILFTQNNNINANLVEQLKLCFNLKTHLHLPNSVFFETSGTYMNTEGDLQRTTKVVASLGQVKTDWQIVRKLISYSSKMLFINKFLKNNKISFNSNTVSHHRNFIGFQYYAVANLTNLALKLLKKINKHSLDNKGFYSKKRSKRLYNSVLKKREKTMIQKYPQKWLSIKYTSLYFREKNNKYLLHNFQFKESQKKLYNSQIRFWLNDFYLDGKDFNSKHSSTMIQCSKLIRINSTNFAK